MAYRKVNDTSLASIADTLRSKGGTTEQLVFPQDFNKAIESLNTFTPPTSEILDPDEVYRTTRPADWLPMPTPRDDEIYLLLHILDGIDGYFAANLIFSGVCSVEFGSVHNGLFVSQDSLTPVSETRFTKTLPYQDYGDVTSDGYRQCMIRIKGTVTRIFLGKDSIREPASLLKDIVCGIDLDGLSCSASGNNTADGNTSIRTLEYVRFVGNGGLKNLGTTFFGCNALRSLSCEKKNSATDGISTLRDCRSLVALSANFLCGLTGRTTYMLAGCGIRHLPKFHATPASLDSMSYSNGCDFERFTSEIFDTRNVTSFQNAFFRCTSLLEILGLRIDKATKFINTFGYTYNLSRLTFAGETTPGGWTINLIDSCLEHAALIEMIESLPVATAAATINLTGNPGASQLTDEEIAVATSKNWTVTI